MDNSVKYTLFRGVLWNSIEKFSIRIVTFLVGILLARLLSPKDYGLLGMLSVFISLSQIFIESGFAKALIQKKDCEEIDYSTAFYINISIAIILYLVLFCISPLVATFYNQPILKVLLRVLSLNFVLGSFNIVQRARLMSNMNFKLLAKINFLGTISGGLIGVGFAFADLGVWALVAQTLSSTFVAFSLFPLYSGWQPKFQFSKQSFNHLFAYGSKLLASSTLSVILTNISTISIGKFFSVSEVGYYTRAVHFSELINSTICEVTGTVTFPIMSKMQHIRERLLYLHKKILLYTAMITIPIMALMATLARPIILVLLTDKWESSIYLFQILCIARMITPMTSLNLNILNAIGRSDLYLKLDFIKIPLSIFRLAVTIPLGVKAIVIGDLIDTSICFFINSYYSHKFFRYGPLQQLKEWRYIILSALIMCIAVFVILQCADNLWLQVFLGGIIGIIVYIACCIFFKIIDISLIKNFIREL